MQRYRIKMHCGEWEALSGRMRRMEMVVEFLAINLWAEQTMRLFDSPFLMKGSGRSAGGKERSA
jgi:hypothetical protein